MITLGPPARCLVKAAATPVGYRQSKADAPNLTRQLVASNPPPIRRNTIITNGKRIPLSSTVLFTTHLRTESLLYIFKPAKMAAMFSQNPLMNGPNYSFNDAPTTNNGEFRQHRFDP